MSRRLTVADQLTLNALLNPSSPTYLNQTRSWLAVRPHCTYFGAAVSAYKWIKRDKIVKAMAKILSKEDAGKKLTAYITQLETVKAGKGVDPLQSTVVKLGAAREMIMDLMRLQGEIVSKSEVTQRTDVHEAMRQVMRRRRLDAAGSSATGTRPGDGVVEAAPSTVNGHGEASAATESASDSSDG